MSSAPESANPDKRFSRRAFLGAAGGVLATGAAIGAGLGVGGSESPPATTPATTTPRPTQPPATPAPTTTPPATAAPTTTTPPPPPRNLVVVQMGGGNDGLNTLIPEAGFYRDKRTSLALPEADLLDLGAATSSRLHPALEPLLSFWESEQLAWVQGVGLPEQSFSHFKAMDTWWRGATPDAERRGWLGRWLDIVGESAQTGIGLGEGSPALQGAQPNSLLVRSPRQFEFQAPSGVNDQSMKRAFTAMSSPVVDDPGLAASQRAIGPTVEAVDLVQAVVENIDAQQFRPDHKIADALEIAAGLLGQNVGTRVVVVGVGGFDTHADQADAHHGLLADLADGSAQLFSQLEASGLADTTLLMTTSEFGRRIRENGSAGTDHGTAGTQLLLGPAVAGGQVIGDVAEDPADPDNLAVSIDARSLYATALSWLNSEDDSLISSATADILMHAPDALGLLVE